MIPNFENTAGSSFMPNAYGYDNATSVFHNNNNSNNSLAYTDNSQQEHSHRHHIEGKEKHSSQQLNSLRDYYQYQAMKDSYSLFTNFSSNFQRFCGHPLDFYGANPYAFYERVHEMEAKMPLEFARVWLDHQSLWRRFSVCGNEMIITKLGRRMFPVLSFGVHSLNFSDLYSMEVEVLPSDNNRYKYVSVTGWRVNGVASQQEGNKRMFHPENIQTGEYWQKNGIAFKRIKLTNKKTAKEGSNNIVLNSMHKYHIQLVIKQIGLDDQVIDTKKFEFKETEFIAVTAYQNDDVTQLKIDHNPFAKAFRDNAAEHCGRTQFTSMYMTQPKRRKLDDYDTSPSSHHDQQQQQISNSTLYMPSNTSHSETNFKQDPNDPINNNAQIIGDEKPRQMYHNLDTYNNYMNSYGNFSNSSYCSTTTSPGWFPSITFDNTEVSTSNLLPISDSDDNNNNNNNNNDECESLKHQNEPSWECNKIGQISDSNSCGNEGIDSTLGTNMKGRV